MKKRMTVFLSATMLAMLAAGCVSYRAESPYRPETVQPSERTVSGQPYRIEEVYMGMAADGTRMYEAIEKQNARSFNAKLNGWLNGTDFEANARAMKEQMQDAQETMKYHAAGAYDVDEDKVTPPMIAFWQSILLVKSDEELAEMALPDYKPADEEWEPTDEQRQMLNNASNSGAMIFGRTATDADSLTEALAEKYPGLFSENGAPLRVAICMMMGPMAWRGQYSGGSDNYLDVGVWVWSSTRSPAQDEAFPLPTASFPAVYHSAYSTLGPANPRQDSKTDPSVKGSEKEAQAFLLDRVCAAIVEAINGLPENRFREIRP